MNKLAGWGIGLGALWLAVKTGLLDMIVSGVVADLAAEAARLTGPLSLLLTGVAGLAGMVGLFLVLHPGKRPLGIELLVVGAMVIAAAHVLPGANGWLNAESKTLSANLSHAAPIAPATTVTGR
jgi:hypothetical protein